MSSLRERFEQREDIKRQLKNDYIFRSGETYQLSDKFNDKSHEIYGVHQINIGWVCGMWEMFQELNDEN